MVSYFVLRAYDAVMMNLRVPKPWAARSSRVWSKMLIPN